MEERKRIVFKKTSTNTYRSITRQSVVFNSLSKSSR